MENASIEKMEIMDSPEQLAASLQQDATPTPTTQEAPQQESQPVEQVTTPEVTPEPTQQAPTAPPPTQETTAQPETVEQTQYSDDQIETAVLEYMSERLGTDINSFDDFYGDEQEQSHLDERVAAIAEFVETTGRSPQDWFKYQSLNPSEMDDLTAVKVDMASKYPNLSSEEVNLLVKNQYKFNTETHGDEQVQLSQLQLKIDAENARKNISEIREKYKAPNVQPQADSFITEDWINEMTGEVNDLTGLQFDLGNDKTFTFTIDDNYKSELIDKNTRLEEYFDPFVRQDGTWDFDALSSHRAVVDNIDQIVSAAYRQGVGDGQKGLVEKAANVSTASPQQGTNSTPSANPLAEQVKQIMSQNSSKMTFKL
jgi:hypothetical protein